jgi:spore coat protein CotH
MRNGPSKTVVVMAVAVGTACGQGGSLPAVPTMPSPASSSAPSFATDPIFDQGRLHEVRIAIDPADWRALQVNYLANQYYAAHISLDGVTVSLVGIRSRGSGSRSFEKPGLKVDFNRYVVDQEYHGYKSIVLRNAVQDASFLRERLGYAAFEAMGLPAPQNSHARLYVNDEYWGLYGVVEPVSKPFLKARLGEESGNLFDYQYVTRYDFSFLGDDPVLYVPLPFEPQTNEDHLDPSGLIDFIRAINEAPTARDLAGFLDLDLFLTYLAVENALAERDGFVGDLGMNNFYLYQYGGARRFVFIPWDKDSCLASATHPILSRVETNVLTRKLLADPALRQTYVNAVRRAVSSFVNTRVLLPRLESAYAQIREAATSDPRKPYSALEFEQAVGGRRGFIAAPVAGVLAQASAR